MADRKQYYFDENVTEDELNEGFDGLENADRNLASDLGFFGIIAGAVVAQHAALANLTVDVSGAGILYDQIGERLYWPNTQNVDVSKDFNAVSTAVAVGGNEKWVSVFAQFVRVLSDPRTDGHSDTIYFSQDEGFAFYVTQGAEAAIGTAARPPMQSAMILLADINFVHGETQVLNGSIDTTRRQDWLVVAGTPISLRNGRIVDAFTSLVQQLDISGAAAIGYGGTGNWADGTTNPATTVESMLDHIVSVLASAGGTAKIEGDAFAGPNGLFSLSAGTLKSQLQAMATAIDEIKPGFKLVARYRIPPASLATPNPLNFGTALATWTDTVYTPAHDYAFAQGSFTVASGDVFVVRAKLNVKLIATSIDGDGAFRLRYSTQAGNASFPEGDCVAGVYIGQDPSDEGLKSLSLEAQLVVTVGMLPITTLGPVVEAASNGPTLTLYDSSSFTIEQWRPTP